MPAAFFLTSMPSMIPNDSKVLKRAFSMLGRDGSIFPMYKVREAPDTQFSGRE